MERSKYTIEVMAYSDKTEGMKKVFITANAKSDVTAIDTKWEVGSILWDVSSGIWYGLTQDGTWVEQ